MRVIRILFGALPLVGLAAGIACAPLVRPQHPNAVAIQIVNAAGGPRCEGPEGVEFNPATVCAPQFDLEQAPGIAASYSRRVWALTKKDGINLRIGPEFVGARISSRRLSAPAGAYPAEVSEWYAAALVRVDAFDDGPALRRRDRVGNRLNFSVGGGLAVGGYRESDALIDGTNRGSGKSDVTVGPVVNFGIGYWITGDLNLRGDLYGMVAKPQLSFPWNRFASFAGIGIVKTF